MLTTLYIKAVETFEFRRLFLLVYRCFFSVAVIFFSFKSIVIFFLIPTKKRRQPNADAFFCPIFGIVSLIKATILILLFKKLNNHFLKNE